MKNNFGSFFKEDGVDMDQIWGKIKKGIKDGAALSMEKIEEYAKIGKLKIEEMAAKRKIERNFLDIGERAFELIVEEKGGDVASDLTIARAVENIKGLREEIIAINAKIKDVSAQAKSSGSKDDEDEVTGI